MLQVERHQEAVVMVAVVREEHTWAPAAMAHRSCRLLAGCRRLHMGHTARRSREQEGASRGEVR